MQSSTYKEIIDDKINEWHSDLNNLEEQAQKVAADKRKDLSDIIENFRKLVQTATVELSNLDKQETAENTLETKEKILEIFRKIDQNFPKYQDKAPFML